MYQEGPGLIMLTHVHNRRSDVSTLSASESGKTMVIGKSCNKWDCNYSKLFLGIQKSHEKCKRYIGNWRVGQSQFFLRGLAPPTLRSSPPKNRTRPTSFNKLAFNFYEADQYFFQLGTSPTHIEQCRQSWRAILAPLHWLTSQ